MTTWGGLDVTGFARAAGFDPVQAKRATAIAFAVSGFNDHYFSGIAGVPSMDQVGLWGLHPDALPTQGPMALYDPATSARVLHSLWANSGESFLWMPVFQLHGGSEVIAAWQALDRGRLWQTRAKSMPQRAGPPTPQPV